MPNNYLARFFLWCALMLTVLVVFTVQLYRGLDISSDILGLLPESDRSAVVQQALDQFTDNFSQQIAFLVGAESPAAAIAAADNVARELSDSDLFAKLNYKVDSDFSSSVFNTYYPFRAGLMSAQDSQRFADNNITAIQQKAMTTLYSPVSPVSSQMLAVDPLFLLSNFLTESQQAASSFTLYQNVLMAQYQQTHYVLIRAELKASVFNLKLQDKLRPLLSRLSDPDQLKLSGTKWLVAGVALHAIAGTELAKNEISLIGGGSILGIVLLIVWVFRSVKPIALAILSIAIGIVSAITVCSLVFGEIHILSMVFGASLVGVSIDYSFHYFCEALHEDGEKVLSHIFPGISLGLLTSLIGYLALFIAPFPGLHQMAVFSSVGLLAAYFTVLGLYPVISKNINGTDITEPNVIKKKAEKPLWMANQLLVFWQRLAQQKKLPWVLLLVSVVLMLMLSWVKSNDDIRLLRHTPDAIVEMENTFACISGARLSAEFFLVTGNTAQQVLEKEERLVNALNTMENIPQYRALTQSIPSVKRQTLQRQWLTRAMTSERSPLYHYLLTTGFDPKIVANYKALLEQAPAFLTMEHWLASPASMLHRQQWINNTDGGAYASMVFLYDLERNGAMRDLAARFDGVEFVDQVSDVSRLFQQYRQLAVKAVVVAYSLIFVLLLLRYSWQRALVVVLPPVYAAALSMAITVLFGHAVNLFSVLALLLVLAIGIDYTLFYSESRLASRSKTALAIALSCMTTLLAFGLLAVSDTPALKSFGLTIATGIAFAFLLAPIACIYGGNKER